MSPSDRDDYRDGPETIRHPCSRDLITLALVVAFWIAVTIVVISLRALLKKNGGAAAFSKSDFAIERADESATRP
jgi:hypothetical protein